LSKAICDKEAEILIYNKKLAQKVRRFKKIRNVTTAGSMLGCALSCGEILLFVTLIFIGVADLYSIYTDYSIVIVTKHPKYGDQTVILRRI
jgi:dolichyl-phosphate-mannose--protein O-mannosyl transferase